MTNQKLKCSLSIAIAVFFNAALMLQHPIISISANKKGIEVSKSLYGIFFEEINHTGEGGVVEITDHHKYGSPEIFLTTVRSTTRMHRRFTMKTILHGR